MTPRNNSNNSLFSRRPSIDPPKLSNDSPTVSRTPSPTEDLVTLEAPASPQRKKGGMFSNLRASVVGKPKRRKSHSHGGSLNASNSSSSMGLGQSRSSTQHSMEFSNHSSAAAEHLKDCGDSDSDSEAAPSSTFKSGVSNTTSASNGSLKPRLVKFDSFKTPKSPSLPSSSSDSDHMDQLYASPNRQTRPRQRRSSHEDVIEEDKASEWGEDSEDEDNDDGDSQVFRHRASSIASSGSDDLSNELDERYESETLIEKLGDKPSQEELSNISAARVNEVIQEKSMEDRRKFSAIPRYTKSDLIIEKHLGKGSFSDVFSVTVTVKESQQGGMGLGVDLNNRISAAIGESGGRRRRPTSGAAFEYKPVNKTTLPPVFKVKEEEDSEEEDLDALIDSKFGGGGGDDSEEEDLDALIDSKFGGGGDDSEEEDLDALIDSKYGPPSDGENSETEDLDALIDSKYGPPSDDENSETEDLDALIDSKFGDSNRSASAPPPSDSMKMDFDKLYEAKFGDGGRSSAPDEEQKPAVESEFKPAQLARPPRRMQRRVTTDLSSSVCVGSMRTLNSSSGSRRQQLAMKCLHPISRANPDNFIIGVEDLVHETLLLSSFNHPNIIKLHGRAELGEGYFILLDKLKDTLDDRIKDWRVKYPQSSKQPPSLSQLKVATSLAETMAYLHDRNIVFRDLKPPNVGFDTMGNLKLFDFGFASEIEDDEPLEDRAGTVRYMAPEVALDKGHKTPADVYSYTVVLWEIIALKKPYAKIKTTAAFTEKVFQGGERPKLGKHWPENMKEELEKGWSEDPNGRPSMDDLTQSLKEWQRQVPARPKIERGPSLRASFIGMSKRFSG